MASGRLLRTWLGITNRCYNESSKDFANYGGRGITMCQAWRDSFATFAADIGEPPSAEHSLDRVDNNKPYDSNNCRWSTRTEQNNNTRRNRRLTFRGRTQTLAQWSRELNLHSRAVQARLAKGWTTEEALTHPFRTKGRHVKNLHVDHAVMSANAKKGAAARWKK